MLLRVLTITAAALALSTAPGAADVPAPLKHKRSSAPIPPSRDCCGSVYRYVYAEAWYGNQKIVAPVRRWGCCDQVLVPGGAWLDCVFSCEITLRKLQLGYWQDQGAGYSSEISPGYPREDFWTDSWGYRHGYLF